MKFSGKWIELEKKIFPSKVTQTQKEILFLNGKENHGIFIVSVRQVLNFRIGYIIFPFFQTLSHFIYHKIV